MKRLRKKIDASLIIMKKTWENLRKRPKLLALLVTAALLVFAGGGYALASYQFGLVRLKHEDATINQKLPDRGGGSVVDADVVTDTENSNSGKNNATSGGGNSKTQPTTNTGNQTPNNTPNNTPNTPTTSTPEEEPVVNDWAASRMVLGLGPCVDSGMGCNPGQTYIYEAYYVDSATISPVKITDCSGSYATNGNTDPNPPYYHYSVTGTAVGFNGCQYSFTAQYYGHYFIHAAATTSANTPQKTKIFLNQQHPCFAGSESRC